MRVVDGELDNVFSQAKTPLTLTVLPPVHLRVRWTRVTKETTTPAVARKMLAILEKTHPDARCELDHEGAFQLLLATVLSAQTTDVNVNKATPRLFADYPDARALAKAEPEEIEPYVKSLGFFRQKARSLVGIARALVERHGGEVPRSLDELVKLPGVGRKTANVVLGVAFGAPEGVVTDTHVIRVSQRLGWTRNTEPEKIERDLCALLPRDEWDRASHLLIFHGRRICFARKPDCERCPLSALCPSAFHAELVGRKLTRTPRARQTKGARRARR
jgi:endonuclease-3